MLHVRLPMLVLGTMLAATVMLAGTAGRAAAATITVNTTLDNNASGQCSLRQAIADVDTPGNNMSGCAAAAFGTNTIVLGPNTYSLQSFGGGELKIAPTVTNLTITGAGEGQTDINMLGGAGARVFEITAGATVTISDLTISGGRGQAGTAGAAGTGGPGAAGGNGGGILNAGTLTLDDARVTGNIGGAGGAGGSGGAVVSGNGASGGAGGVGGNGGGIYNTGTLTLTGAMVDNNYAGLGGNGASASVLAAVTGGVGGAGAAGGAGGGIENQAGTVTITDSTLTGNTSGSGGGGAGGGSGTTTGGAAGNGGAASTGAGLDSAGGSVTVIDSTLASNTAGNGGGGGGGGPGTTTGGAGGAGGAGGSGGAIAVTPATNLIVQSDTFAGNSTGSSGSGGAAGPGVTPGTAGAAGAAGAGGGVFDIGKFVTIQNTLMASDPGGNCDTPSVTDGGHNLSYGDSTCPATFLSGDPKLGALQDNGGPSPTIDLGAGSAALAQIPATGAGCQPTDQRGVGRPAQSECDIGAYEVAQPTATTGKATKIKAASATLNATVTPDAGPSAVVTFDYGTTTKYGKTVTVPNVSGVTPAAAAAQISKLKSGLTYHYRITVTTIDGSATGSDATFVAAPALSKVRFKHGKLSYSDTAAATTKFKVVRGHAKTVARFSHHDRKGTNRVSVHLKPGKYTVVATPSLNGTAGAPVSVTIRIR